MGLKSDTFTKLTKQDVVSGKDGTPSDSTSSLSSSGDATANIKGETDQESVTECTIRQWNGLLPIWL